MRILPLVSATLLACLPVAASAGGPMGEPQAMAYISAPFDARPGDDVLSFGFRVDRTVLERGKETDLRQLLGTPAVMEWRIRDNGVQTLMLGGRDYLAAYGVYGADEQSDSGDANASAPQPAPAQKKRTLGGVLEDTPVGVIVGAGIGIVILATTAAH